MFRFLRDGRKETPKILPFDLKSVEVPFDAGQVEAGLGDLMLLEMENVAARAVDEVRECGVDPLAVRTLHAQDGAIVHDDLPNGLEIVPERTGVPRGVGMGTGTSVEVLLRFELKRDPSLRSG